MTPCGRPRIREFLREVSRLFELHIYTMGSRPYAMAVTGLLDPTTELFYDRVLSRDDAGLAQAFKKSLKRIFPHDDRMVVVLDDRGDVWSHCANLLHVQPFHFFTGVGDIHGPGVQPAPAGIEQEVAGMVPKTEALEDHELDNVLSRLRSIHSLFFSSADPLAAGNVKPLILELRHAVLSGCCLAFSGCYPKHEAGEAPDIVLWAGAFGADTELGDEWLTEPDVTVTHLICARPHSDKHRVAARRGVWVVRPEWLWESCWRWRRQREEGFQLEPPAALETGSDTFFYEEDDVSTESGSSESAEEETAERSPPASKRQRLIENDPAETESSDFDFLDSELGDSDGGADKPKEDPGNDYEDDSDDIYGHSEASGAE